MEGKTNFNQLHYWILCELNVKWFDARTAGKPFPTDPTDGPSATEVARISPQLLSVREDTIDHRPTTDNAHFPHFPSSARGKFSSSIFSRASLWRLFLTLVLGLDVVSGLTAESKCNK